MRVFVDLDVLLDALQKRAPHYDSSYQSLEILTNSVNDLFVSLHSVATLYYFLNKHAGKEKAEEGISWLMTHFQIARCTKQEIWNSIDRGYPDFEDGIVAEEARLESCEVILTRNVKDYKLSPVPALSPEEFLAKSKE